MSQQKKKKATSFKSINKSDNDITRVDEQTFYAKSETNPNQEPYMVYHSQDGRWLCDCTDYWIHIEDNGQYKLCKHILKIQKKFNL